MNANLRPSRRDLLVAGAALAALAAVAPVSAEIARLQLLAPANPGSGWDQTARAVQAALQQEGLVSAVEVTNVAGAAGTIGLAQFITGKRGRGDALLLSGLAMVAGILTNQSPVTLDDVTPLARLIGEYELIVVPAASPYETMQDLVAKLKADPGSVSWGAGSIGSADHILAGQVAKAIGVDPAKINFIVFSGGGEVLAALLGSHVTLGLSGVEEFRAQIEAGKVRGLAVSADERLPGLDVPTLKEQGIDVSLVNWRGLMAPPRIPPKISRCSPTSSTAW